MQTLIELRALTKWFGTPHAGGILAVDGVSFKVERGEVLGFLGPNGAGKSTTMKMVTGFLPPSSGQALVCGNDVAVNPLDVKRTIGYLPEGAPAYADMTPEAFLNFCAQVRGLTGEAGRKAIARAVERTNIQGVLRQPVETLSKGFKRRVGLAQAILHEPRVLIMDEPTDGLDPNQKHEVRALIRDMAHEGAAGCGRAVVLSTHILEEVEAVCTRVVLIARGRVVADCTPAEFMSKSRYHNAVTLALVPPPGVMVFDELRRIAGVADVEDLGTSSTPDGTQVRCTVLASRGKAIAPEVSHLIKSKGWQVDLMRVEAGRLDDVFRDLTTANQPQPTKAAPAGAA
ncbi:MAG: ABC transporter ATP-binding protein [Phycisphaeraceae bacterium]|nr:ABC transporter ATP-binding protein [Phycisphaeraceae bacterium]